MGSKDGDRVRARGTAPRALLSLIESFGDGSTHRFPSTSSSRSWTLQTERFAICLPTKIDASRFSGPEQFFAGAPYIFLKKSTVVFSTPNRPMPMPRSIAVLENDRKRSKKS